MMVLAYEIRKFALKTSEQSRQVDRLFIYLFSTKNELIRWIPFYLFYCHVLLIILNPLSKLKLPSSSSLHPATVTAFFFFFVRHE